MSADYKKDKEYLGSAVVAGAVMFFSVSSLEKGIPRPGGAGCPLRWWYRYVGGRKAEDESLYPDAVAAGHALHDELKLYLRGELPKAALSPLALRGFAMLPRPNNPSFPSNAKLLIERSLHTVQGPGRAQSLLIAAGKPVIGFVDCVNDEPRDEEGRPDPENTIEVIDWKRKGKAKTRDGLSTALHPEDLVHSVQMSGYGEWLHRSLKTIERVRLTHGVFFATGSEPKRITKLHVVDDVARSWEQVERGARTLVDAARERAPLQSLGNVHACSAYGGCPHRDVCPTYRTNALTSVFGPGDIMGLLDSMQQQNLPVAPTPPPAPVPPPASYDYQQTVAASAVDLASQRAALEAEEARLRQQYTTMTPTPAPAPAPPPTPAQLHPVLAKMNAIGAYGRGTPSLGGEVAQAFAAAMGWPYTPGSGYAGTGQLGSLPVLAFATLDQLLSELQGQGAPPAPAPAPPVNQAPGVLPPDAPTSIPALATAGEPKPAAPAAEAPKRGRGRPKKNPDAPVTAPTPPPAVGSTAPDGPFEIYVDCMPNVDTADLAEYARTVNATLAERFCKKIDGSSTGADVRLAPQDGPLGFGRWKAAIRELVVAMPPPAGAYHADTRGSEVLEVVVDAMSEVVATRGGLFVRGYR